jgi:ribosomal protein L3
MGFLAAKHGMSAIVAAACFTAVTTLSKPVTKL